MIMEFRNLYQHWMLARILNSIIIILSSVLLLLIAPSTSTSPPPRSSPHISPHISQSGSNLGTLVSSLLKRPPSFTNDVVHTKSNEIFSPDNNIIISEDTKSIDELPTIGPLVISAMSVRDRAMNQGGHIITEVTDRSWPTAAAADDDEEKSLKINTTPPDVPSSLENETFVNNNNNVDNPEAYNERLKSILENIQHLLPFLIELQHNMTQLLQQPQSTNHINAVDIKTAQLEPAEEEETQLLKSEEFSFPIPSLATPLHDHDLEADSPGYITELIHTLYPHKPFEEVISIVKTMARRSQEVAYQVLADRVFSSYRNKTGRMDVIDMACEIFGKPQFKQIVQKHEDILLTFVFPSFFNGAIFYLEAKSKSDVPKNLYFDRRKNKMGIITTSEPITPGTFQTWTFLPVNDGCYFVLKSSQSDIIVGVIVTKSKESPLFARNVVGVTGLEEGKINYRFQWKIVPYKLRDFDRTHILLENRETNLALEWDEFGNVNLNSVTFQASQLWALG